MFKNLISRIRGDPNRKSRRARRWEGRNLLPNRISTDSLYSSGDRLFQRGFITESERDEFNYKWFNEEDRGKFVMAYVYGNGLWPTIYVSRKCNSLSKWAMDALIWHEMSHYLSRENHGGKVFKKMISKYRFNRTKLLIADLLMCIGWY